MKTKLTVNDIAKICHETNRAYCETLHDFSQKDWINAEVWQRDSAIKGVKFKLENPGALASAQHDAWLEDKRKNGWKYGPVKDADKKEHPCFVPYEELPAEQKAKDALFVGVVTALRGLIASIFLLFAVNTFAVPIAVPVDPGTPGLLVHSTIVPVAAPVIALDGSTIPFTVTFDGGKFLRLYPNLLGYPGTALTFEAGIVFYANDDVPGPASALGYPLDALGQPLFGPEPLLANSGRNILALSLKPIDHGIHSPVDIYGFHLDISLPVADEREIVQCQLHLVDGPFGIGPGVPNTLIPDSGSTWALLLVALCALPLMKRLRHG